MISNNFYRVRRGFAALLFCAGLATPQGGVAATLGFELTYKTGNLKVFHDGVLSDVADSYLWGAVDLIAPQVLTVRVAISDDPATTSTNPVNLNGTQVASSRSYSLSSIDVLLDGVAVFGDDTPPANSSSAQANVVDQIPDASTAIDRFGVKYTLSNSFGSGVFGGFFLGFQTSSFDANADTWISDLNVPSVVQLSAPWVGSTFNFVISDASGSEYSLRSGFGGGPPQINDLTIVPVPLPAGFPMLFGALAAAVGLRRVTTFGRMRNPSNRRQPISAR